jgi:hypothetical protein
VCHGLPVRPRLLVVIAALSALLAVPALAPAAEPTLGSLRGPWAGTLTGADPAIEISVRLSGGKRGSTIAFTGDIECSGVLIYLGRRGGSFRFSEQVRSSDLGGCTPLGLVRLRVRADGRLDYHWRAVGADVSPGRAVLERVLLEG